MYQKKYMVQVTDIQHPFVEIIDDEKRGTAISCVHRHIGGTHICRAERKTFRKLTQKERSELALLLLTENDKTL